MGAAVKATTLWGGAVVVAILSFTAAGAQETCEQLKRKADRAARRYEQQCAAHPSPVPTRSPAPTVKPTLVPDCSDGSFGKMANGFLEMKERFYEPGRPYALCMNVTGSPPAKSGNMRLDSANASDASCDIYELELTSPSGIKYATSGSSVVQGARHEVGRWAVTLTLNPKLGPLCGSGKRGLAMWNSWY